MCTEVFFIRVCTLVIAYLSGIVLSPRWGRPQHLSPALLSHRSFSSFRGCKRCASSSGDSSTAASCASTPSSFLRFFQPDFQNKEPQEYALLIWSHWSFHNPFKLAPFFMEYLNLGHTGWWILIASSSRLAIPCTISFSPSFLLWLPEMESNWPFFPPSLKPAFSQFARSLSSSGVLDVPISTLLPLVFGQLSNDLQSSKKTHT